MMDLDPGKIISIMGTAVLKGGEVVVECLGREFEITILPFSYLEKKRLSGLVECTYTGTRI